MFIADSLIDRADFLAGNRAVHDSTSYNSSPFIEIYVCIPW